MKECKEFIMNYDSVGNPIMGVQCYCGTTACTKGLFKNYRLPFDCPEELDEYGINQKEYYKKLFKTKLK